MRCGQADRSTPHLLLHGGGPTSPPPPPSPTTPSRPHCPPSPPSSARPPIPPYPACTTYSPSPPRRPRPSRPCPVSIRPPSTFSSFSVHQSPSPLHSSEPLQELTHHLSTKKLCISGVYRKPCFPNRLCIKSTLVNNYQCINSRQDQAGASSSIAPAEWILEQKEHSCRDSHNFTLIQAPLQFQFHLHR